MGERHVRRRVTTPHHAAEGYTKLRAGETALVVLEPGTGYALRSGQLVARPECAARGMLEVSIPNRTRNRSGVIPGSTERTIAVKSSRASLSMRLA